MTGEDGRRIVATEDLHGAEGRRLPRRQRGRPIAGRVSEEQWETLAGPVACQVEVLADGSVVLEWEDDDGELAVYELDPMAAWQLCRMLERHLVEMHI